MSEDAHHRGGVDYFVTDEQIRAFLALSPAERIRQSERVQRLVAAASTPRTRMIRDMFRRGEL